MSEKNVTLISKDYIDSNFITSSDERVVVDKTETGYDLALNGSFIERGEYTELENQVRENDNRITELGGTVATVQEDVGTLNSTVTSLEQSVEGNTQAITTLEQEVANKQDTLSAGTGINLNNNTISVNTATSVGTSDLPVTASAVNTKLGDYVNDIQAADDSITVTKTGSSVSLKANGGSIDENRVITGRYETDDYGRNRFIADSKINAIRLEQGVISTDIEMGGINVHNEDADVNADFTVNAFVSAFCPNVIISIPCDEYTGYTAITSNRGTEVMRFQHDTSAGYDTHNTKIYFNTPTYFNTIYISDSDSFDYSAKAMYYDPFMDGTLRIGDDSFCDTTIVGLGAVSLYAKTNVNLGVEHSINLRASDTNGGFNISINNTNLFLDEAKLQKLIQLLES